MLNTEKLVEKTILEYSALITNNEGKLLYDLVRRCSKSGVIVEIGSYKGGSTVILAKSSITYKKGKVYAVDPQGGKQNQMPLDYWGTEYVPSNAKNIFLKNIERAKVGNHVDPIFKTSEEAAKNWREPISLLWIDGNHDYEYVKKDFILWEKYLIKGGIIALHDTRDSETEVLIVNLQIKQLKGPAKVVEENIRSSRFGNIKTVDSITYAVKLKDKNKIQVITDNLLLITLTPRWVLLDFINKMDKNIGLFGIFLSKNFLWLYLLLIRFKGRKNALIQTIILRSSASKVGLNLLFTLLEKNPDKVTTLVEVGDGGASVLFSEFTKDQPENKCLIYGTKQNGLNKFTKLGLKTNKITLISNEKLIYFKKDPPEINLLYINSSAINIGYYLDNIFDFIIDGGWIIIDRHPFSKNASKSFENWLAKMGLKPKIFQENYKVIYFKK